MYMPEYKDRVSLIPYGVPQFLDFAVKLDEYAKSKSCFWEEVVTQASGEPQTRLHTTYEDEESGNILDSDTGKPVRDYYELSIGKDLQPMIGEWLPLPFFRHSGQYHKDDGKPIYERGPTNWARGRLAPDPDDPENGLRLVIVFDMQVEDEDQSGEGRADKTYALSPDDVSSGSTFSLASQTRDNAWFLNEGWIDGWVREVWDNWQKGRKSKSQLAEEYRLVYLATYLLFVDLVEKILGNIQFQVINPASTNPIEVDLILDIGNSRTTGMLVETRVQRSTNLNDSYPLQLRDMDKPENVYAEPFDTRVEFSEAHFGLQAYSRRSGRKTTAFAWPSAVRTGPEATRLASLSACAEGTTGMSSPKRYLWDERDWQATWRYNARKSGEREAMVTRGILPSLLNDSGTPLICMDDKAFTRNNNLKFQDQEIAFESKFTRSSLMMFLFIELLQQALITINSPAQRGRRELPDVPRRLRRVMFTVPAGMPVAEQRIYKRWAEWAVRTLWEGLGWTAFYSAPGRRANQHNFRNSPEICCNWDEATCTQLVYVFNEIKRNYQDDAHLFFSQLGRPLQKYNGKPCLRIASIDVGGGTSDLSITTFVLESDKSATNRVAPRIELRDGFNIAGDDVLKNIVRDLVFECMAKSMELQGVSAASNLTQEIFGKNLPNASISEQNLRAQFVRQIAIPAALAILARYEEKDMQNSGGNISFQLRDIFKWGQDGPEQDSDPGASFALFPAPHENVVDYPQRAVKDRRGAQFSVMDVIIDIPCDKVDACIDNTLRDNLRNMCELVNHYQCDILLLTGRPSCWNAVVRSVFAALPVAPTRIVPMRYYKVGAWYPFADTFGNITDPKTTVVVGSILCALAENSVEGFAFDPNALKITSTARYIGELDPSTGILPREKVWFNVDVNASEGQEFVREGENAIDFSTPIVIGFRQLEVPRWTATRCYRMEYRNEDASQRAQGQTPYKIDLSLAVGEMSEDAQSTRDEGEFKISSITNRSGNTVNAKDIVILLRTLKKEEDEGCWLDTGILY